MTRLRSELHRYRARLPRVAHNANTAWFDREGILLRLDDGCHVGQGEAAPLPRYSPDTVEQCESALRNLDLEALSAACEGDLAGVLRTARRLVPPHLPAARTAVEGAALDLRARRAGVPAWQALLELLGDTAAKPTPVPLSALLQAETASERRAEAVRATERGVASLKLKVGRPGAAAEELAEVLSLQRCLPTVALRLDANRAWSPEEARQRLAGLECVALDYVEEPTEGWSELSGSPVPLALDETLMDTARFERIAGQRDRLKLRACVLKPTVLGGVLGTLAVAQAAKGFGLKIVLSHSFEGPVAFALCAALAVALAATQDSGAAGLDRHAAVDAWPCAALPLGRNVVTVTHAPGLSVPLVEGPR